MNVRWLIDPQISDIDQAELVLTHGPLRMLRNGMPCSWEKGKQNNGRGYKNIDGGIGLEPTGQQGGGEKGRIQTDGPSLKGRTSRGRGGGGCIDYSIGIGIITS